MSHLLEGLNENQALAVQSFGTPLLLLAGAGSGKTKVLTHKISYAIEEKHCDQNSFLAVTFTNKAAREMRHRISQLFGGQGLYDSWISTFHSFGLRVLRQHIQHLGYDSDFTILDSSDQLALTKSILKENHFDNDASKARKILRQISQIKSELETMENLELANIDQTTRIVFDSYQRRLRKNNSLDFSDLLIKTLLLLRNHLDVRSQLQNQFSCLFVDEYQDTNATQYEILKWLAQGKDNVCAVGDEDQSIYSWRGANIYNILNFEKDFPNTRIIKLEQNYRSTKNIIEAASAVITNNSQRKGKKLFTQNPTGSKIQVLETISEYDEGEKICKLIEKKINDSNQTAEDIAIFYRTNAQSRVLEEQLRKFNLPYRIVGGLKFYDRKEIKDIICYMRLIANPKDDISFRRVINVPTRGIGKTSVDKLAAWAAQNNSSLVEAAMHLSQTQELRGRARQQIQKFLDMLMELRECCMEKDLSEFYQTLLDKTSYLPNLQKDSSLEAQGRIENLEEFGNGVLRYCEDHPEGQNLSQFLQHIALMTDETSDSEKQDCVTLMTLHVAKGLEFPIVFITGLEEGLFPHRGRMGESDGDEMEMEEERRLFYVGMTRAKLDLYLSYSKQRSVWGQTNYQAPSRFLKEIPDEYLEQQQAQRRPRIYSSYGSSQEIQSEISHDPFPDYENPTQEDSPKFAIGTRVRHPHFGPGVVHKVEGHGDKEKVSILFDNKTMKKFLSQYANLMC